MSKNIDDRDIRHFRRLIKGIVPLSVAKIASDLNVSFPEPVTTRTVRNYSEEADFACIVKVQRYWLAIQKCQRRVTWCIKCTS